MRRSGSTGPLEGVPDNKMEYRTLWDGVSVALILRFYPERVEQKEAMGQGIVGVPWYRPFE
jgi:hypothetical protein